MRFCNRCSNFKDISEFGKNISKKDGIDIYCKLCNSLKTKNSKKNRNNIKEYNRIYRLKNSDKIKDYQKEYYLENNDIIKKRSAQYQKTEKSKENKRKYRDENSESISLYSSMYRDIKKDELKEYFRVYVSKKRSSDILYKLKDQLSHRISESLRSKGFRKNNSTVNIIGCSLEEFKIYLESRFEDWMNWDNRGLYNGDINYGWDIDHIIPISSAKTEEDLYKLNHYTNLQPLCSFTNRHIKKDKIYEND